MELLVDRVPEPDCAIPTARCHQVPAGRKRHRSDLPFMRSEHGPFLSGCHVPQADRLVNAAARDCPAIGRQRDAGDVAGVTLESALGPSSLQVPEFDGQVPARRGQCGAIGSKRNSGDHAVMPEQRLDFLAGSDIPKFDRLVPTAAGEDLTIGAVRNGSDHAGVAEQGGALRGRFDVPKSNRLVPGAAGDCSAIGRYSDATDDPGMAGEGGAQLAGDRVPEFDRVVPTRRHQFFAAGREGNRGNVAAMSSRFGRRFGFRCGRRGYVTRFPNGRIRRFTWRRRFLRTFDLLGPRNVRKESGRLRRSDFDWRAGETELDRQSAERLRCRRIRARFHDGLAKQKRFADFGIERDDWRQNKVAEQLAELFFVGAGGFVGRHAAVWRGRQEHAAELNRRTGFLRGLHQAQKYGQRPIGERLGPQDQ